MAHIEEIMVNGVLTRVNCLDSTAQEVDDAVSAAANAVNKGGDIMTGALTVALSDLVHTVSANPASGSRFAYLQFRDTTNRTAANLKFSNTQLAWQVTPDMSNWAQYNIFHTGNKPSGSYPGTGSATAQTIFPIVSNPVSALGNMVLICGNGKITVVTKDGGVCTDGTVFASSEVRFVSGTLTVASTNAALNASGNYYYQVL